MSVDETGQMFAVETGQMSAVETGHTYRQRPVARVHIYFVSAADICALSASVLSRMPGPLRSLWDGSNPLQGAVPVPKS